MASSLSDSSSPDRPAIDEDLHDVARFVHEEFDDRLDPHAIDETLGKVAEKFANASVRAFVPLLVRRYVREELQTRLGRVAI